MKKLIVIAAFFCNYFVSAQTVMESTYVDVPLNKVQRFIELYKKVTDLSQVKAERFKDTGFIDIGMVQAMLFSFMMNTIPHNMPLMIISMQPAKKMKAFRQTPKKKWMPFSLTGGHFLTVIGMKCGS